MLKEVLAKMKTSDQQVKCHHQVCLPEDFFKICKIKLKLWNKLYRFLHHLAVELDTIDGSQTKKSYIFVFMYWMYWIYRTDATSSFLNVYIIIFWIINNFVTYCAVFDMDRNMHMNKSWLSPKQTHAFIWNIFSKVNKFDVIIFVSFSYFGRSMLSVLCCYFRNKDRSPWKM